MASPWASAISWLASGGPTLSSAPVISSSGSPEAIGSGVGGRGEGFAVAGVALRVLAHDQLADERGDLGLVAPGGLRQGVGHHGRCDGGGALVPQQGGAVALGLASGLGRFPHRAQQGERGHLLGMAGGELAHDQRARGVPDHTRRLDVQRVQDGGQVVGVRR